MTEAEPQIAPIAPSIAGDKEDHCGWITNGHLLRAMWRLSLPMMLTAVLTDLFTLVDLFFVAKLGPTAVAAVAVAGTIQGVLYMLLIGVTTGCAALVAQAVGAGQRRRAEMVAGQSLLLSLILSACAAATSPLARPLLAAFGAEAEVVAAGTAYLQVFLAGAISMALTVTFSSALRGAGDALAPLKVMAVANVINAVLDPVLIFGLIRFPALGVAGSAWATLISRSIAALLLARLFFVCGHEHFHLRLADMRPHGRTIWQMFRIGVFGSGQMLMRNISAVALIRIVATFGTAAVAAYGIGMRLRMVVMMPGMGLGNAAMTLVGQNLGAGKPARAERAGWAVTGMYALLCVIAAVVFYAFDEPLIAFFNSTPSVVKTGASFLRWFAPTFVFMACSIVLGRAINGAGDTMWPMLITAISMLALRIPLAWGLSAAWGTVGIWGALAASNIFQGLLFAASWRWGRWKRIGHGHVNEQWQSAACTPDLSKG